MSALAGEKENYDIRLNVDQMSFIRNVKDKYNIPDESKVMRVVMDYLITSPDVHDTVFSQSRCLRCE